MLAQWVAEAEWTSGDSLRLRFRRRLRRLILRVADPVVSYPSDAGDLRMPLSHELPRYRRLYPTYDRPIEQVVAHLRERIGSTFRVIDVGANVGDSAVAILASGADCVLCVEGVERYLRLLRDNVRGYGARVAVAPHFLTEKPQPMASRVVRGTAVADRGGPGDSASITFMDLIRQHPDFSGAQLLKIDTDGWDQAVITSAAPWLKERQPAVFFEHDPVLQRNQGYDSEGVWPVLAGLGYRSAQVWSNTGFPLWRGEIIDAANAIAGCLAECPYVDVLTTAAISL